jgi:nitrogenase molybdenum-iron protein beta chain
VALPLERPGAGCALHGALHSAAAIPGVVPILHGTAGCAIQSCRNAAAAGWGGPDPLGGVATPACNIFEKQVVFGATARLREQIKNTAKVINGELLVVLSSCATEMIGDDVPAMAKEARDQGLKVLSIASAGFRGSAHDGYGLFLKGVLARPSLLGPAGEREPGLVNLLGIVPRQDAFWEGELAEWSRLLAGIGLRANPVFGHEGSVEGLRDLARAGMSLVLSPWGMEAARLLERDAGVPWLDAGIAPVGAADTTVLVRTLAGRVGADAAQTEAFLAAEMRREDHHLHRLAQAYYRHDLQREFALVAGSLHGIGLAAFLVGTLGWIPRTIVIADGAPEAARAEMQRRLAALTEGFGTRVLFSEDAGEIRSAIVEHGAEIVLGRSFEATAAEALGVPLVQIAFPVIDRLVVDKGLSGVRGAVTLVEEIARAVLAHEGGASGA